jgi:hypothetical protein
MNASNARMAMVDSNCPTRVFTASTAVASNPQTRVAINDCETDDSCGIIVVTKTAEENPNISPATDHLK